MAGLIVERHVNAGKIVTAEEPLFLVVDPSFMWAVLDVPERDVGTLTVGMSATVRVTALPDQVFQGETAYIAPAVDKASRTVSVRVPIANPDLTLRAHMFATASIETRARAPSVRIPAAALQRVAEVDLVFVQTSPTTFETRRVTVAQRQGDHVVLSAGLAPNEPVVAAGSFLLKTEILKDSIGAGCCETD
jgi:cobalt-zinc-cadmium efflux system membrane fusion protein